MIWLASSERVHADIAFDLCKVDAHRSVDLPQSYKPDTAVAAIHTNMQVENLITLLQLNQCKRVDKAPGKLECKMKRRAEVEGKLGRMAYIITYEERDVESSKESSH